MGRVRPDGIRQELVLQVGFATAVYAGIFQTPATHLLEGDGCLVSKCCRVEATSFELGHRFHAFNTSFVYDAHKTNNYCCHPLPCPLASYILSNPHLNLLFSCCSHGYLWRLTPLLKYAKASA